MDRRRRKSQQAIMSAFLNLLDTRAFESISIVQIIELADVSRGTFYSNFEDIFDLRKQFVDYHINRLFAVCSNVSENEPEYYKAIFANMFEFLRENSSEYKILFSRESTVYFREAFQNLLTQQFVAAASSSDDYSMEFSFLSSGVVGFLKYWIEAETPYSTQVATDKLWDLLNKIPFFGSHKGRLIK